MAGVGAVAVLVVVTLIVLSLTVFRPSNDPTAGTDPSATEQERRDPSDGGGEYVPEGEESEEPAPEQTTTVEAPTEECAFLPQEATNTQDGPERSSGDLTFTVPEGWGSDMDWRGSLPYSTEVASAERQVDDGFYAVARVAQVEWPDEQGGYPGAEQAATAFVQCHLTRETGVEVYGEDPTMTQYVSETVEVDGHEGWMVRGVVELQNPGSITEYSSAEIIVVVVETPSGPAVFHLSGPADIPERAAEAQQMVDSLAVG